MNGLAACVSLSGTFNKHFSKHNALSNHGIRNNALCSGKLVLPVLVFIYLFIYFIIVYLSSKCKMAHFYEEKLRASQTACIYLYERYESRFSEKESL